MRKLLLEAHHTKVYNLLKNDTPDPDSIAACREMWAVIQTTRDGRKFVTAIISVFVSNIIRNLVREKQLPVTTPVKILTLSVTSALIADMMKTGTP